MTTLTGKPILVADGTGNAGRHLADAVLAADGTAVVPSRPAEKLQALARGPRRGRPRPAPAAPG